MHNNSDAHQSHRNDRHACPGQADPDREEHDTGQSVEAGAGAGSRFRDRGTPGERSAQRRAVQRGVAFEATGASADMSEGSALDVQHDLEDSDQRADAQRGNEDRSDQRPASLRHGSGQCPKSEHTEEDDDALGVAVDLTEDGAPWRAGRQRTDDGPYQEGQGNE